MLSVRLANSWTTSARHVGAGFTGGGRAGVRTSASASRSSSDGMPTATVRIGSTPAVSHAGRSRSPSTSQTTGLYSGLGRCPEPAIGFAVSASFWQYRKKSRSAGSS